MPWTQPPQEREPTLLERVGLFVYRLGWLGVTGFVIFGAIVGWSLMD